VPIDDFAEAANAFDARVGLFEMQDQHVAAAVAQHLDHRLARQLAALIIVRPHVSRDVHFLDFAFEIAGEHRHAGFVGFLDGRRNGDPVGGIQDNGRHALGAWTALQQVGKTEHVKIIGFDGQLEGKQAIKEGKIYADPIQFPEKMGVLTMQNILKYLDGEPFEPVTYIPTELYRKADADRDPALQ